jgi:hypothetical protein
MLCHWLYSLILNQKAVGIVGFAVESERIQRKQGPQLPTITNPVHFLLQKGWGKTPKDPNSKAVLWSTFQFFYSCADLSLLWAENFYTTWRQRGTFKGFCNMHNKNVYNENLKFQLHGNNSGCVGAFQLLRDHAPAQLRGNIGYDPSAGFTFAGPTYTMSGAWYLWRGRGTYGQSVIFHSQQRACPETIGFFSFIFSCGTHRYCLARTAALQERNTLCRFKQVRVSWLVATCFLTAVEAYTSHTMNFVRGLTVTGCKKQVHIINQRPFCNEYYYWQTLKAADTTRPPFWHIQALQYSIPETAVSRNRKHPVNFNVFLAPIMEFLSELLPCCIRQ